ncbi:MAG: hypothetical protein Tsb0020_32170 [Haliangiales bacterium]
MDTPTYRSPLPIARFVTGALLVSGLHQLVNIYYDLELLNLLPAAFNGDTAATDAVIALSSSLESLTYAGIVLLILCGVGFFAWAYRANNNARALGAGHMQNSPGWTIGWFFMPILGMWKPYFAIKEIWHASRPEGDLDATPESGMEWLTEPDATPWFLPMWWWAWLGAGIAAQLGAVWLTDAMSLEDNQFALTVDIVASAIDVAATGLVLAVIWSTTKRQLTRAERRSLPTATLTI